jgi:hypothetical protein
MGGGMGLITYAIPYYRNPAMLSEQYRIWAGYPEDLKEQIEIVLVDDGSPEPAIDVPRPDHRRSRVAPARGPEHRRA